jgi:hypothetical protein
MILDLISVFWSDRACGQETQYETGNAWLHYCSGQINSYEFGVCLGAVAGLGYYEAGLDLLGMQKLYCTPPKVTSGQKIAILKKFLQNNPELLHEHISLLMIKAFRDTFPCSMRK